MKIYQYLHFHIKIICRRFCIIILFTFITFFTFECIHSKYIKCLFTNIQKQQNMLKSYLLFKYKTSRVNDSRILRVKNAKFSWLLYEPEHKVKFSSLHQCTCKTAHIRLNRYGSQCSKEREGTVLNYSLSFWLAQKLLYISLRKE